MISFNKIILIGNLTKDPDLRYMPSGKSVTTLRLAVNHKYKQGDEVKDEALFIDVVAFGKQAENCAEYLRKGRSALIEGRLQQRRWESEDGQKRVKYEVVAQNIKFMSSKGSSTLPNGTSKETKEDSPAENGGSEEMDMSADMSDVPF